MSVRVKIRIVAASEAEGLEAISYLERLLPGLKIGLPREGSNPKYEGSGEVLAYGDLETEPRMPPRRTAPLQMKDRRTVRRARSSAGRPPRKTPRRARSAEAPPPPQRRQKRVYGGPVPLLPPPAEGRGRKA